MNIFNKFFGLLVELEGGFSHHEYDKGGRTNFGITERALFIYNKKTDHTYKIQNLTQDQAKEIYRTMYFNMIKPYQDEQAYYHYFDICVNSGFDDYSDCRIMTKGDVAAITKWRRKFYEMIVKSNPSQAVFLKGWNNRIDKINSFFTQAKQ